MFHIVEPSRIAERAVVRVGWLEATAGGWVSGIHDEGSHDVDGEERDLTEVEEAHREMEAEERRARREAIYNRRQFEGLQIDPEIDFYPEVADREPGDTNIVRWGFDLHPHVTFVSAGLLLVLLVYVLVFPDSANSAFENIQTFVNDVFGWFLILTGNIFVVACAFFAFSRFGKIRIGGPTAVPEFSTPAWYAMLISAGMGIGLMFFSVAEPIWHFTGPPPMFGVDPGSIGASKAAMATTFYHWGVHPWAIYALVSLGLSFFAYNRGLPLTFRSVFYPILGPRIYGTWGNVIDILTVLATLFGLATSLGFGVGQAAAGLNFLFGLPSGTGFQVTLIVVITAMATLSVVAGLDAGVKRLSQLNIGLAMAFMLFIIVVGPTIFILKIFGQSVGYYFQNFAELSFWNETFTGTNWQAGWTILYWAWWISWSPFVGMFIARISKGRTVREFITAVLLVPTLVTVVWMGTFGGSALDQVQNGIGELSNGISEVSLAMFQMLANLPIADISSFVAIVLVLVFFITSSDSGSLVIDSITAGGKVDAPTPQRIFWATMEGVIAGALLFGGGGDALGALQAAAITVGLPFTLVLLAMCVGLYMGLTHEWRFVQGPAAVAQT